MIAADTFIGKGEPIRVECPAPSEMVIDLRRLRTRQNSIDGDKLALILAGPFDVNRAELVVERGLDKILYLRDGHHAASAAIIVGHELWKFWRWSGVELRNVPPPKVEMNG